MQASLYCRGICTNDLARLLFACVIWRFPKLPSESSHCQAERLWYVLRMPTLAMSCKVCWRKNASVPITCWQSPNRLEDSLEGNKRIMLLNTKWYCNACLLLQKKHSKIAITWLNWLNTHVSSGMIINSFISQNWDSSLSLFLSRERENLLRPKGKREINKP